MFKPESVCLYPALHDSKWLVQCLAVNLYQEPEQEQSLASWSRALSPEFKEVIQLFASPEAGR